jgi:tetratricopeptide (TPR) repeat protein
LFATQEKVIKKIQQDRQRGDLKRAQRRALDGIKKWPDDYDLAMEAVQLSFELSDFHQAVSILKSAIKRHHGRRREILSYARETFMQSFNPFLGSFVTESLLRNRDFEGVRDILSRSSESFVNDLIKRSETRSKSASEGGGPNTTTSMDNELLLGLLYVENNQPEKAVEPLGRALEHSPDDAQLIGSLLVEVERERPGLAEAKLQLGLASIALSHPEKAEGRFFQSLALKDPPLEKILLAIESIDEKSDNYLLLKGEILIRMENFDEGISCIREFIAGDTSGEWKPNAKEDQIKQLFPGHLDRREITLQRLSTLPESSMNNLAVTLLYCETTVGLEKVKEAVEALDRLFEATGEHATEMISWIGENDEVYQSAPAQKLLTALHLASGDTDRAAESASLAAEMDKSQIPSLVKMVESSRSGDGESEPGLLMILAELNARSGNLESAEEILKSLEGDDRIESADLLKLTGEVMKHGGVSLNGVVSAIEIGIVNNRIAEALPYTIEFYRGHPEVHRDFADELQELAGKHEERGWSTISGLTDELAKEGELTKPFRILQATAHLETGSVERAIFEFDQLIMLDEDLRFDLIERYEDAAEKFSDNTTLHLALYQLHLEENQLAESAHFLCKTLQLDPSQIKDVVARFDKLVEKEPDNMRIWEEMLKTALEMNHLSLAKEILSRAVSMISHEEAAALHIYGARISTADGKIEDALRCIAMTLTSPRTDMRQVEEELKSIISREPANAEAQYLMGEALVNLGRENDAISSFKQCLDLSGAYKAKIKSRLERLLPMSIKPWLITRILGEIAWAEGRFEEGISMLSSAQKGPKESLGDLSRSLESMISKAPEDGRVSLLLARNLILEGKYAESVAHLEELVNSNDSLSGPVIESLQELLGSAPDQPEANTLLAHLWLKSGETSRTLDPVLRLLKNTSLAASDLDRMAKEFYDIHKDNSLFLVRYATMKARVGMNDEAVAQYRRALEIDSGSWEKILVDLDSHSWPADFYDASRMLKIDCLLHGGRDDGAFELIRHFGDPDPETSLLLVTRIESLIEKAPAQGHFSSACRLLAGAGNIDRAEELVRKGCELLPEDECVELKIELAEAYQGFSQNDRADEIFKEVISSSRDRSKVLKRIEATYEEWSDREIARGMKKLVEGQLTSAEAARLVSLNLDRANPEQALEVIAASSLPERVRSVMLAMTYICLERPILALAVAGSVPRSDSSSDDLESEALYLEGIASEKLGYYGRAAAAFSKLCAMHGEYRDSRGRAERNYSSFISSQFEDGILIIEKTATLEPRSTEGEDER